MAKPGYKTIPDAARTVGRSSRHVWGLVENGAVRSIETAVFSDGRKRRLVSMVSLRAYERHHTIRKPSS